MKYHIIAFGCQMNISDSERISTILEKLKYKKTSNINEANLIVVVMCSVRQSAVDRVHGLAQKFKKINPKIKTVLTGCVLKKDRKKFANSFDYVIDIKDIKKLPQILENNPRQILRHGVRSDEGQNDYLSITPKYSNKFSATVPIMTGCNNFCSYCVVPYTRDREISRPAKEIITEIKNLIKKGYKEIWLLGQNVNSYHGTWNMEHKTKQIGFADLLRMIDNIPENFWIRFTSSHPKNFSDELIKVMARRKHITPYLNLPVQSGDNKVLKSMNRHYSVAQYKNTIKKLRKQIPDISLSTDRIIGFPGETKKQFENTAELFHKIKFDMAYINKYSPRAGTAAEKLKDDVSITEKKRREKVLTKILKQTALEKNKMLVGKKTIVLIEEKKNDFWIGKNEQYKTVKIISNKNLLGKFVRVKITEAVYENNCDTCLAGFGCNFIHLAYQKISAWMGRCPGKICAGRGDNKR